MTMAQKILSSRFLRPRKITSLTSNMSPAHFSCFLKDSPHLKLLLLFSLPVILSALSVLGAAAGKELSLVVL